jgi:hypothetical protein
MSLLEKLKKVNLTEKDEVTLIYEDGLDVVHYTGNYYDDVIEDTAVASSLANLATNLPTSHTRWSKTPIIETMREDGYFEGYEEGEINTDLVNKHHQRVLERMRLAKLLNRRIRPQAWICDMYRRGDGSLQ